MQFDLTFPRMPCAWLSLDAMDISGEMHLDVVSTHLAATRCTGAPVTLDCWLLCGGTYPDSNVVG